jgi:predicted O-methyltransferase YrrM
LDPLPTGMWRTSRWLRRYDWDWEQRPYAGVDVRSAALRAATYPRHFFYHVHTVADAARGASGHLIEYSDALQDILIMAGDPATLQDMADGELGRRYTAEAVSEVLRGLISRGLIVPADMEEPVDTVAVAEAAAALYIAIQVPGEFARAMDVVKDHAPRTVVEVGTAGGGALFGWAQVAQPDARLVSVDLPGGVGGGGYLPHHTAHFRTFCGPDQQLHCILGDSHSPGVIRRVHSALDGRPVDFLLIDGDHSYEGARQDFENYSGLVPEGGLIFFHDIQPPPSDAPQPMGVWRFWREIKDNYRHAEIVNDPNQFSAGFGILYV